MFSNQPPPPCVCSYKQTKQQNQIGKEKIRIDNLNHVKSQWNLFPLYFRRINLHVWWIVRQVMGEGNVTVSVGEKKNVDPVTTVYINTIIIIIIQRRKKVSNELNARRRPSLTFLTSPSYRIKKTTIKWTSTLLRVDVYRKGVALNHTQC